MIPIFPPSATHYFTTPNPEADVVPGSTTTFAAPTPYSDMALAFSNTTLINLTTEKTLELVNTSGPFPGTPTSSNPLPTLTFGSSATSYYPSTIASMTIKKLTHRN